MKIQIFKISLLIGLVGMVLSACVKDYNCECVTTFDNDSTSSEIHVYTGKKDWAKETCELQNAAGTYFVRECEIK